MDTAWAPGNVLDTTWPLVSCSRSYINGNKLICRISDYTLTVANVQVSMHFVYGIYLGLARPFADKVQQVIEVITITCQTLLLTSFVYMMDSSSAVAEKFALGSFPSPQLIGC